MRNTGISFYKKLCAFFPFKNDCQVWGRMQEGTPAQYHKVRAGLLIQTLSGNIDHDFTIVVGVVRHLMLYWVKTHGTTIPNETETPQT